MGRAKAPTWQLGTIAAKKLADGRWEARGYYRDGGDDRCQAKRRARTKAAAENAVKGAVRAAEAESRQLIKVPALTIGELAAEWLDLRKPAPVALDSAAQCAVITTDGLRAQTWNQYDKVLRHHVIPTLGALQVSEVTTPQCEKAVLRLYDTTTGRGYRTAGLAKQVLQQLMDYAVRQGFRDYNPVKSVSRVPKPRQRPTTLTQNAVSAIQAAVVAVDPEPGVGGPKPTSRTSDAVLLLRMTGLRIGEALGLRWEDIDSDSRLMTISVTGTLVEQGSIFYRQSYPKTEQSVRTLQASDSELTDMLGRRRLNAKATPTGALFPTRNGTFVRPSNFRTVLRRAKLEAGIEEALTPHSFRRTVASGVAAKYGDEAASIMLGHSSPETTRGHYIARPAVVPDYSDALRAVSPRSPTRLADAQERANS